MKIFFNLEKTNVNASKKVTAQWMSILSCTDKIPLYPVLFPDLNQIKISFTFQEHEHNISINNLLQHLKTS